MKGFNHITIAGNVTRDPNIKMLGDVMVADFSVAVNKKSGEYERCDFIRCRAWRGLAETIEKYMYKGQGILVAGELRVDKYQDKNGFNREYVYILVNKLVFLTWRDGGEDYRGNHLNDMGYPADVIEKAKGEASKIVTQDILNEFNAEVVVDEDDIPF